MTTAEAIEHLRADPEHADLIRDAYLGPHTREASSRFQHSAEFEETVRVVGGFEGRDVLDLGAGTGIASLAIANAGAARVYAVTRTPRRSLGGARSPGWGTIGSRSSTAWVGDSTA